MLVVMMRWGEWGLENIAVPGNACGLDISDDPGAPLDGKLLLPHNVDSLSQKYLLLIVFTWFADCMAYCI